MPRRDTTSPVQPLSRAACSPSRPASVALVSALCTTVALLAVSPAGAQNAPAAAAAPGSAASAPTVRPAFATPMIAAQEMLREQKTSAALTKINEAAAVPDLTPYEVMVLERTRAAAAQQLNDKPLILKSLEAAFATGLVAKADQASLAESIVSIAADFKDHPRVLLWSKRYADFGGTNDAVAVARIQSQMATGDERSAQAALAARLDAADRERRTLPESHLRTLLSLQHKAKDPGATRTVERLATAYPRPEYWADIVVAAARDPQMPDRTLLPLYRLLRRTGFLARLELGEEMAGIALKLGQPGETLSILEEVSSAPGAKPLPPSAQTLRDQARRQAATEAADRPAAEAAARRAADGNALVDLGWAMVASLPAGSVAAQVEPGLALLQAGVEKGGLRRPAEARLHLGIAQLAAGRTDAARQTLRSLSAQSASDPLAVPIRLWTMFAEAPPMLPTRQ